LVGALVPMAALGGLTMNMSYMLAGSAGVNPILALAAGIVLVGRGNSSVLGLDGLVAWMLRQRSLSVLRNWATPVLNGLQPAPARAAGRLITR
jgi:hypothetical protein